MSLGLML